MNHAARRAATAALTLTFIATTAAVASAPATAGPQRPADTGHHHGHIGHHHGHPSHHHGRGTAITSPADNAHPAFDLVHTSVQRRGHHLVFTEKVSGRAGTKLPPSTGAFAGSHVLSYVWPTSLDPSTVGFPTGTGTLALAATSHPDFDDTPRYDENRNGSTSDDGARWHAHWIVLVPDPTRGDGALKVRDIPTGTRPSLPKTWPGVPLYLDSPPYRTQVGGHTIRIRVPLKDVGFPRQFAYDGVTAALRINADLHDPLLRVTNVFDIASGNLSLPGRT